MKVGNKLLAILLAFCMVLTMVSVTAFADSEVREEEESVSEMQVETDMDNSSKLDEEDIEGEEVTEDPETKGEESEEVTEEPEEKEEVVEKEEEQQEDTTETAVAPIAMEKAAAGDIAIDDTNFPDENFRTYVKEFDLDQNDQLSEEERNKVTDIDVHSKSISDLTGIEHFTALTTLDCSGSMYFGNKLTSLDVSKNTALITLKCSRNKLTSLDVSNNTKLTNLNCEENKLTSLDVSKNTELISLDCGGSNVSSRYQNQLTSLDLSKNKKLTTLDCSENNLTSIDLSKNTELTTLNCSLNQLTGLDVSKNTKLTDLNCAADYLTTLDVSKNTELTSLNCGSRSDYHPNYNQLTSLDLSKNTKLTMLDCSYNLLTSLDLSKNTKLTDLDCYENRLTSLDVSNNTELILLVCGSEDFTNDGNQLTSLNLSKNIKLTLLSCSFNQLTSLDVSKNTELEKLYCDGNYLTSLDVSKNIKLDSLWCDRNHLTSLDLSQIGVSEDTYLSTGWQTVAMPATFVDEEWQINLTGIVGTDNLENVSLPEDSAYSYDTDTGIVYLGDELPETFKYDYDTGYSESEIMYVTVTPYASDHTITKGANSTWTQGSEDVLPFSANGYVDNLIEVMVDDDTVSEEMYTVSGSTDYEFQEFLDRWNATYKQPVYAYSTDIGLEKEFLDTLSAGKHTLTFVYEDGECSAEFEIVAAPVPDYAIIEGANSSWTQNSDGSLTFRANGDIEKFTGVKVDGNLLSEDTYTVTSGSTVITLKKEYLDTLSVGTHTLTVLYEDGECGTEFEIMATAVTPVTPVEPDEPSLEPDEPSLEPDEPSLEPVQREEADDTVVETTDNPPMGDESNLPLWIALLILCGAVAAGTKVLGKRKE